MRFIPILIGIPRSPVPNTFGIGTRMSENTVSADIDYKLYEFIAVQNILEKGYEAKRLIDLESPAF